MSSVEQKGVRPFLGKPSVEGEKKTCTVCKWLDGSIVELHAVMNTQYHNLQWKEPDEKTHIKRISEGVYKHPPELETSDEKPDDTPTILQKIEPSSSAVINELRDYIATHMELANEIRISVQKLADDNGYFADANDKKTILGYTAHDIIMAKLTPDVVGARIGEKTKKSSVEIDEVANSSQVLVRGASRTFHTSSAIKDEVELWQQQSLENFAQPLFFLIRNKRFVPKCEIHGTVCNEETFECKKCVDNADKQKRKQDLFNSSSMIDTSLLL
jgi:hypothetical protein